MSRDTKLKIIEAGHQAVEQLIKVAKEKIIKPLFVCTLGRHAAQLIVDKNISMSKVHGQRFEVDGYYIFPIHHPAAALYARSTLTTLEEDFAKLYQLLKAGLEVPLQECEQPHQMGLF